MVSINLTTLLSFLADFSIQFGIVVAVLFIATKLRRFITQFNYKQGAYQSNRAIAISTIGFYTSIILIVLTSVKGVSYGYLSDIISILSISFLGLLFLTLNRWIINLFYLKEFNPAYELNRDNIAFAIFQSGGFIATSIIFYSSFAEFEFNLGLISVGTLYFLITQLFLFIFVKIFILKTSYDDIREIQRGNISVAIEFLSLFISLSLLFGNIAKEVVNIDLISIASMFIYFAISSISLLYIPNLVTSLISSGDKKVEKSIGDGNMVVSIKSGAVKILVAILIVETLPLSIVVG